MPSVEANGEKLEYVERGDGAPLVLLHGIGSDASLWAGVVEALDGKHKTYAFNLRGHGGSSCNGALSVETLAADIAMATAAIGMKSFHLAGVSLGGAVAVAVAAQVPNRVLSLTVSGIGAESSKALADEIYGIREAVHYLVPDDFAQQVSEALLVPDAPPEAVEAIGRAIGVITKQRYLKSLEALAAAKPGSAGPGVKAPSLVLHGALDEMVSKADADALGRAIAGAQRAELPDAGHLANIDDPKAFAAALAGFLAGR